MTRIAIDPVRPVGRLDRKVFGGFVEHLGRCTVDPARLYFFDPGTGQAITG